MDDNELRGRLADIENRMGSFDGYSIAALAAATVAILTLARSNPTLGDEIKEAIDRCALGLERRDGEISEASRQSHRVAHKRLSHIIDQLEALASKLGRTPDP